MVLGGRELGETLVDDARIRLVSATGSTAMGRSVAPRLAGRFARAIMELGGNNAAIVCPSARLDLAVRAIAFAAMGTAGQRCTTLRRLLLHEAVYDEAKGTIRIVDKGPGCSCPMVKEGVTPPSFCDCTLGWQVEAYSTILGRPVTAELEESVLRGGKKCIYRIKVV